MERPSVTRSRCFRHPQFLQDRVFSKSFSYCQCFRSPYRSTKWLYLRYGGHYNDYFSSEILPVPNSEGARSDATDVVITV
jgi:hypothetical protein